jgi:hypothetical protein
MPVHAAIENLELPPSLHSPFSFAQAPPRRPVAQGAEARSVQAEAK